LIDDVVKNVNGDVEQRRSLIIELADRLFILHERVNANQSSTKLDAGARRPQLDQILARREYRVEEEQESSLRKLLKRLWDAFLRFLSMFRPAQRQAPVIKGGDSLTWFRIFILLVVFVAAAAGIWRLIKRIKHRQKSEKEKELREILGEEIPEDITVADLLSKANELARRGDYRTAIRRAYIASLFELEQRGKLRLHSSKTNRDYLDALRLEREIFPGFSTMTGVFERIWYGQIGASEDEFKGFIFQYDETLKR
jgi:hypothetical protein